LRLLEARNCAHKSIRLQIDYPDAVVAEFGNVQARARRIERQVIYSPGNIAQSNLCLQCQWRSIKGVCRGLDHCEGERSEKACAMTG
jgi:hypothetical protein